MPKTADDDAVDGSNLEDELHDIIDKLLGPNISHLPAKEIPHRLRDYEASYDGEILGADSWAFLEGHCQSDALADVALDREELFNLLITLRPTEDKPASKTKHNRRRSDRVRSPSDSPSTSDDDNNSPRPGSAARPFPTDDAYMMPATLATERPPIPRRIKTLSDAASDKFAARERDLPPSAYPGIGFHRPLPANHARRRSSGRDFSARSDESFDSARSASGRHHREGSYSPGFESVDHGSFHEGLRSPTAFDLDDTEDQIDPSRLEDIRGGWSKQKAKLEQELRDGQKTIAVLEAEQHQLGDRLDAERREWELLKRDIKSGYERRMLEERQQLEAQLDTARQDLEAAREAMASLKHIMKNYEDQLGRYREDLIGRDEKIQLLESSLESESDAKDSALVAVARAEQDKKALVEKVELQAHIDHQLAVQKMENSHLQSTIEGLEYDLSKLKMMMRGDHGANSGPTTLSRKTGASIGSELRGETEEVATQVRERVIETVITRTIKVNAESPNEVISTSETTYTDASVATDTPPVSPLPQSSTLPTVAEGDETITPMPDAHAAELAKARMPSHLEAALQSPPAYSPTLPPDHKHVLEVTHPREGSGFSSLFDEDDYDNLVDTLGVRCPVMESKIDEVVARRVSKRRSRLARVPEMTIPFIGRVNAFTVGATIFAFGLALGTTLRKPSGFNSRDYYNLQFSGGIPNEGFMPSGSNQWAYLGARAAGYVPS